MKNRSTQDPFPEEVTNRPRDLRLIAMSGAVRQARHEPSPTWLLVLGVLLGILMCMAFSVWQAASRAAESAQPWPTTGSEYHGQAAPEVEP